MSHHPGEAHSISDPDFRGPAAELLAERNAWSEWMADYDVERLSWMRLAAMLLRDVPVAMVVNRLAAGLAARQAIDAQIIMEMWEDDDDYDGREVDWAFWLERWNSDRRAPYDDFVIELDRELFASFGGGLAVSWSSREDEGVVTPRALLWFLLSAIRGWATRVKSAPAVKPAARWILELHRGDRANADPIAALLAHFYDRFQAGGYAPAKPLPDTLDIEKPRMVRGVQPRRDKREAHGSAACH